MLIDMYNELLFIIDFMIKYLKIMKHDSYACLLFTLHTYI